MESFLSDRVMAFLLGMLAVVFALSWLARRHPHVG